VGAVLAGGLLWGVFGSVETAVDGQGIITRPGGLFNAVAHEGGQIGTLHVRVGDNVRQGQTLAQIDRPLLGVETKAARADLDRLRSEHVQLVKLLRESDERYLAALTKQRATLESAIAARKHFRQEIARGLEVSRAALKQQHKQLETLVTALEQRLKAERLLLEKLSQAGRTGPDSARELDAARRNVADLEDRLSVVRTDLTRQDVSAVQTEMTARHQEDQAEESIQGYTLQLSTLAREESERSTRQKEQLLARQAVVDAAEDRLRFLEARYRIITQVVSNWDGRVVEVPVDPGQVVQNGSPVAAIEVSDPTLRLTVYVPAWGGKKIKPGLKVEVTPALIKRAEYGYILGTVRSVSPFALSPEAMNQLIPNRAVVEQLTRGATLAIDVELEQDSTTPSGYHWSTGRGPDLALESGMFCQVRIVTREQPPVTLLLPALRKVFGVE
jgi:HlyD family secretion protein